MNSKEGNTIKGIVKGYANVTSKELTQFYLYLEEISAVRTPTMYGKNVKKRFQKEKYMHKSSIKKMKKTT